MEPFISRTDLGDYLGRDVSTDDGALICVDAGCEIVRDITGQTVQPRHRHRVLRRHRHRRSAAGAVPGQLGRLGRGRRLRRAAYLERGRKSTDFSVDDKGVLLATDTAGTSLFGRSWPHGRQNVRVTYDYGYTVGSLGDVPSSVRQIALTIASRLFIQGPKLFESLGDLNVRYAAESTALMPTERMVLRRYKRAR